MTAEEPESNFLASRVSGGIMNSSTSPLTKDSKAPASAKRGLWVLALTILIWMPLWALLRAWAIVLLWGWFVMPQFGAAPLSWPIAAGFSVLFGFLTGTDKTTSKPDKEMEENTKHVAWADTMRQSILPNFGTELLRIGITLLFGMIIHLFVKHG